jgi:hypothetical protein
MQSPARDRPLACDAHRRWLNDKVLTWTMAVLRFAVTRMPEDRRAVLDLAQDMDRLAGGSSSFTYFVRTSSELCDAIANPDEPRRRVILRRHLAAVTHARLRQVLKSAVELEADHRTSRPRARGLRHSGRLWKGLAS